jgi:hypothetical protein
MTEIWQFISFCYLSSWVSRLFWLGFRPFAMPWPAFDMYAHLVAANLLQRAENAVDFLLGSVLAACHRVLTEDIAASLRAKRPGQHGSPFWRLANTGADLTED